MNIPKLKAVIRLDGTEVYATHFTEEGYLMDKPILTRTGIFEYANGDGTVRRELRLPEEVFSKESLESYKGKPIIITHEAGLIDKDNIGNEYIGTILSDGEKFGGDKVVAEIVIHETDAMKECGLRELSIGYNLELEDTPGVWNGMPYDAIQRNIRVNHLALVQEARAGDSARLNIDGKKDKTILTGGRQTQMAKKTKKVNMDGVVSEQELARLIKEYLESKTKTDADDVDAVKPADAVTTPDDAGKKEVKKVSKPQKVAPVAEKDVEAEVVETPTPKKKKVVAVEEVKKDAAPVAKPAQPATQPAQPAAQPAAKAQAPKPQPTAKAPQAAPQAAPAKAPTPKAVPKPQPKAQAEEEEKDAKIERYESIIDSLLAKLDYQFPDKSDEEDVDTIPEDIEEDEDEEVIEEEFEEDEDTEDEDYEEDEDEEDFEEDEDDEDFEAETEEDEDDEDFEEDDEDEDFEEDEDEEDLDDELEEDEDEEDFEEDEDDEEFEEDEDDLLDDEESEEDEDDEEFEEDEDDPEDFEEDEDDEEFEEDEDDEEGQVSINSFKKDEGACCGNKKYQEDHRHDGKRKSKRMDSMSPAEIQRAIDKAAVERAKLGIIGNQINLDGLETMPIRKAKMAVVKKIRPSMRLDGKSDAYVNAAFDMAVKDLNATRKKGTEYQKRQMFKMDGKYDFEAEKHSASGDARASMIKRIETQSRTKKKED